MREIEKKIVSFLYEKTSYSNSVKIYDFFHCYCSKSNFENLPIWNKFSDDFIIIVRFCSQYHLFHEQHEQMFLNLITSIGSEYIPEEIYHQYERNFKSSLKIDESILNSLLSLGEVIIHSKKEWLANGDNAQFAFISPDFPELLSHYFQAWIEEEIVSIRTKIRYDEADLRADNITPEKDKELNSGIQTLKKKIEDLMQYRLP